MRIKPTSRRGLAIIPALVCLVVVTTLCAAMLRTVRTQRGLSGDESRALQTEWLIESGVSLARARLASDKTYQGETWDLSPDALGGSSAGTVTVVIENDKDNTARKRVRVGAEYPKGNVNRVRLTKRLTIDIKT